MHIKPNENSWRDKPNAIAEMEDDYQQWIGTAHDMATPAQKLQEIVETLAPPNMPTRQQMQHRQFRERDRVSLGGRRVLEAIAAHPNAPPQLLAELFEIAPTETARGLSRNPVAPFLPLELPAFAANLPQSGQLALLREADCPPIFAQQMANVSSLSNKSANMRKYLDARNGSVEEAARLHVAVAGELPPESEAWQNAVREYWQTVCADPNADDRDQADELAEIGLAPSWAAVGGAAHSKAEKPQQMPNYPYLDAWFRYECAEDSPEEAAMLEQIGPDVHDRKLFGRALRADGRVSDLMCVAQLEVSGRGLIVQALIRHPNTNDRVLEAVAARKSGVPFHELLGHEQAGPELLVKLMENRDPKLRAQARHHKNALRDNGESARRAFVARAYREWESDRYPGSDVSLSPFASFVASLVYGVQSTPARLLHRAESLRWTERMEAVFIVSANPDLLRADDAGRTCAALLDHLSLDGNRLVRAAARAYRADPNLCFVL